MTAGVPESPCASYCRVDEVGAVEAVAVAAGLCAEDVGTFGKMDREGLLELEWAAVGG